MATHTQVAPSASPIAFTFEPSYSIRIVMIHDDPWFVAKDVATALDLTWSGNRIKHVPEKWRGATSVVTPSGAQEMAVLSEFGLYFFLNRSDSPKALHFQEKVAEILVTIRKTGTYTHPAAKAEPPPSSERGLSQQERRAISAAASSIERFLRYTSCAQSTAFTYAMLCARFGVSKVEQLTPHQLAPALDFLRALEKDAHAFYLEQDRREAEWRREKRTALVSAGGAQ